jgi:hypothetical protein
MSIRKYFCARTLESVGKERRLGFKAPRHPWCKTLKTGLPPESDKKVALGFSWTLPRLSNMAFCGAQSTALHSSRFCNLLGGAQLQSIGQQTRGTGEVSTSYYRCSSGALNFSTLRMKRSQQGHTRGTLRTERSTAILARREVYRSFALHATADEKQVVSKAVSEEVSETQTAEAGKDERIRDVIHGDSERVHTTSGYLAKVLAFVAGAFLALQGPQIAMAGVQKVSCERFQALRQCFEMLRSKAFSL